MNTEWSLEELYSGLDDPAYEADAVALEQEIKMLGELVKAGQGAPETDEAVRLLLSEEHITELLEKLFGYLMLRQSVNTEDGGVMAQLNRIQRMVAKAAPTESAAKKRLARIADIDAMAEGSEVIAAYRFFLKENKKSAAHLLSDEMEEMVSAMNLTAGSAWGQLQSYLTSTVKVDYEGAQVTLSEIRNMAYSPDAKVRRAAYEAELAAYERIEDAVAFSINNIKNQVTMLTEKRGYESPLSMTLEQAHMSRETLDAMMEAIGEYLPVLRKYLRKKAELLGYENGLPWYELFAPLGKADKTYTPEEAKEYLCGTFSAFSPEMADMMREAFDNRWIDFYPRKGKEGGAFCAGLPNLKQSRILTNYDGYFGSIGTLAHELGHAFHNRQLENERPLNHEYPMPVAETASTFNEVHLGRHALKTAEGDERLYLLENDLKEQTQTIVDIYSRYLFETAVFEQSQSKFLMAQDLKALMTDAQRQAYGDGLDENFLHPYMWVCKSHYYSESLSFYNFPYAFGNLFALGLYSIFLKEGESFVPKYKAMLKATPCCSIEECGAMMGIDLTKKEFWIESLKQIAASVEEFCK